MTESPVDFTARPVLSLPLMTACLVNACEASAGHDGGRFWHEHATSCALDHRVLRGLVVARTCRGFALGIFFLTAFFGVGAGLVNRHQAEREQHQKENNDPKNDLSHVSKRFTSRLDLMLAVVQIYKS